MTKRTSTRETPPRPKFFRHVKRPEWGVGRVTDEFAGLLRVRFEDGSTRDFRDDVLQPVTESEVPEAVRNPPPEVPAAATRVSPRVRSRSPVRPKP